MAARGVLQKRITIGGDTTTASVILTQEMEEWLDCGSFLDVYFTVHFVGISLASGDSLTFQLLTTDEKRSDTDDTANAGPASIVEEWTGVTTALPWKRHYAFGDASGVTATEKPVDRWAFWRAEVIKSTGGPFSIQLEVFATLKRPA